MDLSNALVPIGTLLSVVGLAVAGGISYGAMATRVRHLESQQERSSQLAATMSSQLAATLAEMMQALARVEEQVRALRRDVDSPTRRVG